VKILYDVSYLGLNYADSALLTGIPRAQDRILHAALAHDDLRPTCAALQNYAAQLYFAEYLRHEWPHPRPPLIRVWQHPRVSDRIARWMASRLRCEGGWPRLSTRPERSALRLALDQVVRTAKWHGVPTRFDIFHSLYYGLPPRGAIGGRARVLTVFDLAPIRFPEFFPPEFNFAHFRGIMRSVEPGRDHVITCSASTKRDFCDFTSISADQVHVVPLAASAAVFHPEREPRRIATVRRRYGIPPGRYLLALFTLEPRKNAAGLVRAFAELVRRSELAETTLVIAGALGWDSAIERQLGVDAALRQRIVFTGRVPDADMSPLYSAATAFVYPSYYEGFGLPVLEAMQCGVPVIASNTSSLPEVVGDAGVLVDPHDIEGLTNAIHGVITDDTRRAELGRAGLARSRLFSWERHMAETVDVYRAALEPIPLGQLDETR